MVPEVPDVFEAQPLVVADVALAPYVVLLAVDGLDGMLLYPNASTS